MLFDNIVWANGFYVCSTHILLNEYYILIRYILIMYIYIYIYNCIISGMLQITFLKFYLDRDGFYCVISY